VKIERIKVNSFYRNAISTEIENRKESATITITINRVDRNILAEEGPFLLIEEITWFYIYI